MQYGLTSKVDIVLLLYAQLGLACIGAVVDVVQGSQPQHSGKLMVGVQVSACQVALQADCEAERLVICSITHTYVTISLAKRVLMRRTMVGYCD